ncbi:hypothetical protein O181_063187 [Austropuccinia psidii MF-1]|uniref:CCHC-type domain-containing protein n=1 Tax=Austropuccinia psidii MF-1 TaxID=1389203 RepID=A0A9Q3ETK4_9BASI|nr:hypothetical protein [Austropuccinia psidii MF-1]
MLQVDYGIPDELITDRSHSLFEKSAKRWYYGIRQTYCKNTWSWWKQEIINKWANDAWRNVTKNGTHENTQECGGELEHALRSRCIETCYTEEYINALEEIVTRTKIGRTWKKLDINSQNNPFIKKDKSRKTLKPNTSNNNEQRKCHKCGGIGHLANNCLKQAKINEIVEAEDHNDKEEESDSKKDTEELETSESDEINIINAQINNID